jgi:hypothetical protein
MLCVITIGSAINIGHTQKNGAGLIVNTIKTAPFFCVYPVYNNISKNFTILRLILQT